MKVSTIPIRRLDKKSTLTVRIQVTREFRVRAWLAARLITLAARILGCGVDIGVKENNDGGE